MLYKDSRCWCIALCCVFVFFYPICKYGAGQIQIGPNIPISIHRGNCGLFDPIGKHGVGHIRGEPNIPVSIQ